ncbi:MAG: hypothetical protein M1837_003360 [Sclerophora amabilis]|nr:MAG: hypothetical protein M1837_003360 [Sclerophora amabilis]
MSSRNTVLQVNALELIPADKNQTYDNPSYTLQTFIPPHAHAAYLSLHALNITLALLPDTTSNPTVGAMRIQFWRDAINKTFAGNPPKEPIALLLSHALSSMSASASGAQAPLSKSWFLRLISAREARLNNPPFPDMEALESYAESTYSTLLYLTLSALPLHSLTADHLASHIGKATGIVTILRGLPLVAFPPPPNHHSNKGQLGGVLSPSNSGQSQQGRVPLPLTIMATHNVVEEAVLRQGAAAPGLKDAVFQVATRANDHLVTAREMLQNIRAQQPVGHAFEHEGEEGHQYGPPDSSDGVEVGGGKAGEDAQAAEVERAFCALMPAVSTQLWLQRLEKLDFDIFNPQLRRREWRLPWKAFFAFRRRTF